MGFISNFFERPRFRDGVKLSLEGHTARLEYREQGCDVRFPDEAAQESARLLTLLQGGGHTQKELAAECEALREHLTDILTELDRLGLLTESELPPAEGQSGEQFYRELRRFVERFKRRIATSAFTRAMRNGQVSREQLIGYAVEYYHVVHAAPRIMAPALAHHETPATAKTLLDFYVSELRHDLMIERSLSAVGITREQVQAAVPLPATFTLCSSLGVYARQDPLSFKAALFLFEQPYPEFNDAFVESCRRLGLPDGFFEPILQHAALNDEGDHEDISRALLADVALVSREEQIVVKKHIGILLETMVLQEEQILRHYGAASASILRSFD